VITYQPSCEAGRSGVQTGESLFVANSNRASGKSTLFHRALNSFFAPLAVCVAVATATSALAGGGPENVLLLVNSNSDSSKTIANHYIQWRKIPSNNVVYLDWKGSLGICSGKNFREQILLPALKAIDDRRLTPQIDYVVYSSDFPWRMELQDAFPEAKFTAPFDPRASITGATYLTPLMVSKNPAIVMPHVNWYVPGPSEINQWACQQLANVPTRGFRSRALWDKDGKKTADPKLGQRYLLSTMLGVTRGRGNTVEQVLSYLRRSIAADGTHPKGTIYFMKNADVRSAARHNCYDSVAAQINRLGVRAVVQQGRIPTRAVDIMGLMTGVVEFDLAAAGNAILPGAICENLTSSGGVLTAGAAQTPLTEFLRLGAAGSSGTVTEPRAIQAKFPLPSLHLHYVRGCSLAESFYQSISGPYQLLIVGDPLCQPWAVFPKVMLAGVEPTKTISGTVTLKPTGGAGVRPIAVLELFIDGRLVARSAPGQAVRLDTTKLSDGYHEIRLVGISADVIETQGRQIVPVMVNNKNVAIKFEVSPLPSVNHLGKLKVKVSQPGATAIVIRQNNREVGRVKGEAGEVEIPAINLGRGPTTLQAFSEGETAASSPPMQIQVN
jgi:hypothetical protein